MITFALDCSVRNVTLAIIKDKKIIASYNDIPKKSQSEELMKIIDSLLLEAKIDLSHITQVLYCNGPGSFTSLRIGLATLKGLFWDKGISFFVVSSLLFRCHAKEAECSETMVMSSIRMGRGRYAVGVLNREDNSFEEKVVQEKQNAEKKNQESDCTDPRAFITILQNKTYQKSSITDAKINYLVAPDIG